MVYQRQPSEGRNGHWSLGPESNAATEDLRYSMTIPTTSNNVGDTSNTSGINNDSNSQFTPATDTFSNPTPCSIPSSFEPLCQAVDSILQARSGFNAPLPPTISNIPEISYIESISSDINEWNMDTFDGMQAFDTNVRYSIMPKFKSSHHPVILPFPN